MKIEYIFFIGFVTAFVLGLAMQPYMTSQKEPSSMIEVEFENFLLTQTDEEGFKGVLKGTSAQKYSDLLMIKSPFAYDKEGATVEGKTAKLVKDNLYIDEDVIITTPEGARLLSESILYDTKKQTFETLAPFTAYYGEHIVKGRKLWYADSIVRSKDIKANIKQDK
jgi:hypothetical protein